jgi:hypothetical protein
MTTKDGKIKGAAIISKDITRIKKIRGSNNAKCFFYCKEGHFKNDCPIWKHIYEKEVGNAKAKVGISVALWIGINH